MIGNVCLRPVGTRGGCGAGWGPCACPGGMTIGLGCVRPTGLIPTRTSTRPPHPPHSAPCPYRTGDAPSPMRLATFIRRLGRKRPNGDDSPIRSSKFIRKGISPAKIESRVILEGVCVHNVYCRSMLLPQGESFDSWLFVLMFGPISSDLFAF